MIMNTDPLLDKIQIASVLLKALSNEKRLHITCALLQGEKAVGTLEQLVGLSQSALSQHLARLRRDKIVKTRRSAQTIYYSIADPAAEKVVKALSEVLCDEDCESHGSYMEQDSA
jgi:DNA-binding transcriptional ArsR family regulator